MRHCALRLHASTSPFSSALQAAAGRAWARRVVTPTKHPSARELPQRLSASLGSASFSSAPISRASSSKQHRGQHHQPMNVGYFDVNSVSVADFCNPDPGRALDQHLPGLPATHQQTVLAGTTIGTGMPTRPTPSALPVPKSKRSLWQNILHLISFQNPSLPSLLDYHDLYPFFRSARSYNILIELAIRRASFGTAQWLLSSMREDHIPSNLETWKLKVRWLVRSGWWDLAWNQVTSAAAAGIIPSYREQSVQEIPLPIWLEFCASLKRGSVRRRMRSFDLIDVGHSTEEIPMISSEVLSESPHRIRHRQNLLLQSMAKSPYDLAAAHPRTIYYLTKVLLRNGQNAAASSLTASYFRRLPDPISINWTLKCLDTIHLHMAYATEGKGLRRFYVARRLLISFLKLHPSLRPTSTTLFLLLGFLAASKRCGTIAMSVVRSFKKQWGASIEDRRVRRRLASLALKEGRMDILQTTLESERAHQWMHESWNLEKSVLGGSKRTSCRTLVRFPDKMLHRRNGREMQLWRLLIQRIRHVQLGKTNK